MLRRLCLFSVLLASKLMVSAQQQWSATAPNKTLQITLTQDAAGLRYQVKSGSELLVKPSVLGLQTAGGTEGALQLMKVESRPIREQYRMVTGKQKEVSAQANETSVLFKRADGLVMRIDLRAYNDGVAFRYAFPGLNRSLTITNELTQFALPEGKVWVQPYDVPTDYTPAYENEYANGIATGTPAKDSGGWAFPALFQANRHWLLVTEAGLDRNYFGAHLDSNCTAGVYRIARPMQSEGKGFGANTATADAPFATPWRVIMAGKDLGVIVTSNLVHHLSPPSKLGTATWVKPGRSSWSWWGDHDSSRDFEKLRKFVDLAAAMGWEFSLVDANWNIMQGGSMEQLVQYAAEKKVGLLVWYNSGGPHNVVTEQPRDIMSDAAKRKAEFRKLRQWGVKGIKVDFFQSDKQALIKLYHDILEDAAREQLMVNFHGCTLPRGWSRTYPNLVSMEAVKGAENYGWGKEFAQHAPIQNTILPFTRNVVGPMDYTPVTFSGYDCCPHITTNAHELALSVLFETGILHFADRIPEYQQLAAPVKTFLRKVPVTWDEIRFVQGAPGQEAVLARRKGASWYVAGVNGTAKDKPVQLQLPFLSAANYKATILADGSDARNISTTEQRLAKGKPLALRMLPHGGFVVVLEPAK